jgi:hypothetical protein
LLLPLALNVTLLLMLSSLLLLTLALQNRLQAAVQRQRRQTEDQLMNAAQQWAGRVQRQCPEALAAADDTWSSQPWSSQPGCRDLQSGEGYRLVSYAPGGDSDQGTGELVLELSGEEAPASGARGAFALHWRRPASAGSVAGEAPPRLLGIEERGLRAAASEAAGEVAP